MGKKKIKIKKRELSNKNWWATEIISRRKGKYKKYIKYRDKLDRQKYIEKKKAERIEEETKRKKRRSGAEKSEERSRYLEIQK